MVESTSGGMSGSQGFLTFATGSFQKEFADSSPRLCRKERRSIKQSEVCLGTAEDIGRGPFWPLTCEGFRVQETDWQKKNARPGKHKKKPFISVTPCKMRHLC